MKRYQSHKVVEAAPIIAAKFAADGSGNVVVKGTDEEGGNPCYAVPAGFKRPNTEPFMDADGGDYLVRYDDGYLSWSPKAVFEAGHTELGQQFSEVAEFPHSAETSRNWMDTAAQHWRNEQFYHGLVVKMGELFGDAAKTSDDGTLQSEVLALRVPELVEALVRQKRATLSPD